MSYWPSWKRRLPTRALPEQNHSLHASGSDAIQHRIRPGLCCQNYSRLITHTRTLYVRSLPEHKRPKTDAFISENAASVELKVSDLRVSSVLLGIILLYCSVNFLPAGPQTTLRDCPRCRAEVHAVSWSFGWILSTSRFETGSTALPHWGPHPVLLPTMIS